MIDLSFLKGKVVGVVGLGKTGNSVVEALKKAKVKYKTYDDNNIDESKPESFFIDAVEDFLKDLDLIIWSPGIDVNEHKVAQKAREKEIKIICDIDLLYRACPDATYIGITGTNGKSTTVTLMQHILKENGVISQLGGNIGNPSMDLEMLGENGIYILELSSYQLELLQDIRFDAGGILNLSNDHLARHKSMDNYSDIKKSLLEKSNIKIISIDDEYCRDIADSFKDKITISVDGNNANIIIKDERLKDFDLDIMRVDSLEYLKGKHNYQNIAFAYALLRYATKLSVENISIGILRFKGLEHRQQLVKTINGVSFINDSKATNCDATEKALAAYENILWIVGGQSKGSFDSLKQYIPKIKKAYIIGECEQELVGFFKKNKYKNYEICKTLDKAVEKSVSDGEDGDVVLLSPACASWDQFDSFERRGDIFIKLVDRLG